MMSSDFCDTVQGQYRQCFGSPSHKPARAMHRPRAAPPLRGAA